jgi:hypothetical protein
LQHPVRPRVSTTNELSAVLLVRLSPASNKNTCDHIVRRKADKYRKSCEGVWSHRSLGIFDSSSSCFRVSPSFFTYNRRSPKRVSSSSKCSLTKTAPLEMASKTCRQ